MAYDGLEYLHLCPNLQLPFRNHWHTSRFAATIVDQKQISMYKTKIPKPTIRSSVREWTTFSSSTSAGLEKSTWNVAQGSYTVIQRMHYDDSLTVTYISPCPPCPSHFPFPCSPLFLSLYSARYLRCSSKS